MFSTVTVEAGNVEFEDKDVEVENKSIGQSPRAALVHAVGG